MSFSLNIVRSASLALVLALGGGVLTGCSDDAVQPASSRVRILILVAMLNLLWFASARGHPPKPTRTCATKARAPRYEVAARA